MMRPFLVVLFACSMSTTTVTADAIPTKEVPAQVAWRSGEVRGGVVIGSFGRFAATRDGVIGFDSQLSAITFISDDATRVSTVEVRGEAPGHVPMAVDADVDPTGDALVVLQGMPPARCVVRSPIDPPFRVTESLEATFEGAGFAAGVSARIAGPYVATHRTWQERSELRRRRARLVVYDVQDGSRTILAEDDALDDSPIDGLTTWVWDLDEDGVAYLNDDYDAAVVRAIEPDGTERYRVEMPTTTVRKSADLIEQNLESYEKLREINPDLVPEVVETYRVIAGISARGRPQELLVTTSRSLGRGVAALDRVAWWVLDAPTGAIAHRESLRLPDGVWTIRGVAWFEDLVYVLGVDESHDAGLEVVCFRRAGHSGD